MRTKRNPRISIAIRAMLGTAFASAMAIGPLSAVADEEAAELERVQVTGSRLSRLDIETAAPVTTVTREDIERNGYDSLGTLIQSLPSTSGSPTNTYVNNGGSGAARPDLRGLGSPRTLVLVNGRRSDVVNDLNSIPLAMVERVEILKDGASAIYGADAVAGVVNVITRSNFEGFEASVQYSNWTDANAPTRRASLTYGSSDSHGHFLVGFDWTEQSAALQGDTSRNILFESDWAVIDDQDFLNRGFIHTGSNPTVSPLGSTSTPGGIFNVGGNYVTLDYSGSGDSRTYASGTSASDFRAPEFPADYYNYAPINFIQTPSERMSAFFEGSRELNRWVRGYFEGQLLHNRWNRQLAELPYFSIFDPGYEVAPGVRGISADNYYNPFGVDVVDVRRRVVEVGGRYLQRDLNAYRMVLGFDGDIGSSSWTWDVNYNISRSLYSDTSSGNFAGSRLELAMGPSGVNNGQVVCGQPDGAGNVADSDVISGCVPVNFFGGPGSITQEMLNYLSVDTNDIIRSHTAIWNGSVSGNLFQMNGGMAQAAVGFETRRERYAYTPDSAVVLRSVTGNSGEGTAGAKGVDSIFGEIYLPIFDGARLANLLDLTVGIRNDNFDTFGSETSAQVGLRWKPVQDVLLRATWAQSFREPSISDLYSGMRDSFPGATDPCAIANWSNLSSDAQARCIASGVPAGGVNDNRTQLRAGVGGNAQLGPEQGESYTIGFGWNPSFLDGFSMMIDYWNVDLERAISSYTVNAVLDKCIREGLADFCNKIDRTDGTGFVDRVMTLQENVGTMKARGIDLSMNLNHGAWGGMMAHQLLLTQLISRKTQPFDGAPFTKQDGMFDVVVGGNFSEAAFPKTRAVYRNDYKFGNWGVSGSLEYISSIKDPLSDPEDDLYYDVGSIFYVDLSGAYHFSTGTSVRLGINNVFDEQAPFVPNGFNATTEPRLYRMMGRGYFINFTQSF